jgi:hypothetical protein
MWVESREIEGTHGGPKGTSVEPRSTGLGRVGWPTHRRDQERPQPRIVRWPSASASAWVAWSQCCGDTDARVALRFPACLRRRLGSTNRRCSGLANTRDASAPGPDTAGRAGLVISTHCHVTQPAVLQNAPGASVRLVHPLMRGPEASPFLTSRASRHECGATGGLTCPQTDNVT